MQNYYRVHVQLGKKDRRQLGGMLTKGRESARVLRRASILRQLDGGQKAAQVAANVGVAAKTVRAVARRYEEEGLESALNAHSLAQTTQFVETALLGANAVNETRFQFFNVSGSNIAPNTTASIQVLNAFTGGGSP